MESLKNDLYFKVAESDFELKLCYRLRYKVYCEEKKWLSVDQFPDKLESDIYDNKSVHVMAFNSDFEAVGMMRILKESEYDSLPYQHHPAMKGEKLQIPNAAELSRFVITSDESRFYVLKGLTRAVYQTSRKMGIDNWIFVHEPSLKRLLGMFKYHIEPVCQPTKYYGGFTQVGVTDIAHTEKLWKMNDVETYRFNRADMNVMSALKELVTT